MTDKSKLTVREVAERLGVARGKVILWINSGELRAVDVATKRRGDSPAVRRRRWRIDVADLKAFEDSRANQAAPPPIREERRSRGPGRRQATQYIE